MMYTAIIESINSKYSYKVRIPELNKIASAVGATPVAELYDAVVAQTPGVTPLFKVGEKVFVEFLRYGNNIPVILGYQYNETNSNKVSDAHFQSVVVDSSAKLPATTSIGLITGDNIKCLKNLDKNIANELSSLNTTVSTHTSDLSTLSDRIDTVNKSLEDHEKLNINSTGTGISNSTLIHITKTKYNAWDARSKMFYPIAAQYNVNDDDEERATSPIRLTEDSYGDKLPEDKQWSQSEKDARRGQLFFQIIN